MIAALLLLVAGIGLSAFFSGSETGFYRVARVRLTLEAIGGSWTSRALLWLSHQPSLFVATTLVGNNLANYITSLATVMATQIWFPSEGLWVVLLAPVAIAPLVFVCGELMPKNMFYDAPNRLLRLAAPMLLTCTVLFLPVTLVLWALGQLLRLLSGKSPQELRLTIARRELAELLTEGHQVGILRPVQQTLAQAMLAVAEQPVKNFASPAGRVVRVTTTMSKSDVLRLAQLHRRTLLPVEETRGKRRLVGSLRMIDLVMDETSSLPEPKPMVELNENESCLTALRKLSQSDDVLGHLLTDEGKTSGFVTGRELRLALLKAQ